MVLISPWIDIILWTLLAYLVEYGFYKWRKINILEWKYIFFWIIYELLL